MSGNALPFIGNFYMYLIVVANTDQISNTNTCLFMIFKDKYTNFLYSNINANTYLNPALLESVVIVYKTFRVHS